MTTSISDWAVSSVEMSTLDGLLPYEVRVTSEDGPASLVESMAVGEFIAGRQPWACGRSLQRVRPDATLRPTGGELVRSATFGDMRADLVRGDGWTLYAHRYANGNANVQVCAVSEELATRVLVEAIDGAVTEVEPTTVPIGFWHQRSRSERPIEHALWPEIRHNYAAAPATALDRLIALQPDDIRGRLLLLHGAPGTGKTTVLRSLATHWREWCQVDCVLDPEVMFADTAYLMAVVLGSPQHQHAARNQGDERWRLLLLEDCDELIRSEAKTATGQALSRLLNLTDGLLGQGRKILIAITTNEDLARLHPATVRPGRCLAQIEVGPLSRTEATTWLGRPDGIGPEGATLATLYALRDGDPAYVSETPVPSGMYL